MVIVRAGAAIEEIATTVVAVGIPSKETSGHVVSEILTSTIVVATSECFVKCTGRNVKTQLIPTRNTIVIVDAVPLERLLLLLLLLELCLCLLLLEGRCPVGMTQVRHQRSVRRRCSIDRIPKVTAFTLDHGVLLNMSVRSQAVILGAIVQKEVDIIILRQLSELQTEVIRRDEVVHKVEHIASTDYE